MSNPNFLRESVVVWGTLIWGIWVLSLLVLEARQKKEKRNKRKTNLTLSPHEFWVLPQFFSCYKSSCNSKMGIKRTRGHEDYCFLSKWTPSRNENLFKPAGFTHGFMKISNSPRYHRCDWVDHRWYAALGDQVLGWSPFESYYDLRQLNLWIPMRFGLRPWIQATVREVNIV